MVSCTGRLIISSCSVCVTISGYSFAFSFFYLFLSVYVIPFSLNICLRYMRPHFRQHRRTVLVDFSKRKTTRIDIDNRFFFRQKIVTIHHNSPSQTGEDSTEAGSTKEDLTGEESTRKESAREESSRKKSRQEQKKFSSIKAN